MKSKLVGRLFHFRFNPEKFFLRVSIVIFFIGFGFSCSNSGVQGTSLFSKFQGIDSIEAISPTTVRINWGLDASYSEYRIYENDSVSPVKTETFGTTTITSLQPNTTYYYQISGYSEKTGEVFIGGKVPVKTLENFTGLTAGGVTLKTTTEIKLSWVMNSEKTKFKIFHKNQTGTWNKSVPTVVIENANQYTISNLTSGATYCFYIEAEYQDGTFQPTGVSTEGQLNAAAQCKQMTSPLPSLPSVNISSYTFGDFPWFWTANGDPTYRIEVRELGTDRRVASRTGNGYFRSSISLSSGTKYYYALVTNLVGEVSTVSVDIAGAQSKPNNYIRKIDDTGSHGPIYPPILSDGFGPQNLGDQLVSGDFNCDGLPDLAVSSNSSVPFNTPEHYTSIGAVTVYYTYEYIEFDEFGTPLTKRTLKRDLLPAPTASAPNPQLISFPVTSSNTEFGKKLAVGNFNGDCYQKNFNEANLAPRRGNCDQIYSTLLSKTPTNLYQTKKCDDLAISTSTGSFFIVYGDPNLGLVSGSMSNTYGIDEQTCDAVSSTCRASRYNAPTGYTSSDFSTAIAAGDFNNDGFDDLAVSAARTADNINDILLYRGNSLGLFPFSHASNFALINPSDASTGLSGPEQITLPTDQFGFSLTAVPNSRLCVKDSPAGAVYRNATYFPNPSSQSIKGLDATKCSDLVIGAPNRASNRGSIYSCRGTQPVTGDKQQITGWTCKEHYPNPINGESVINYGYSLLGVANQNGYPMADNVINAGLAKPNPWGTLFVGAPLSTINTTTSVGSVYGYYVTHDNGNNYQFGIQTVLGISPAHTVTADNAVPCDQSNYICEIQRIYPATVQTGMRFGYKLSSIYEKAGQLDPWMPMLAVSAPYRDNINTSGQTMVDSGAVYLFRGDISTFMNQDDNGTEITFPMYNSAKPLPCNDGNCTWLSGGVSPFGSTLLYNKDLASYSYFGISGAAGLLPTSDFSFNEDTQTDLFVAAPQNNIPTTNNGGIYGYYSSSGSFSPTVVTPDISILTNQSLEGNYKFEEAKIIGDINGDGYDDVMAHINNNNNWVVVVYYGSASGLIQNPTPSYNAAGLQPKLFKSVIDTGMGAQFYPVGDVNGDGFSDVLLLSSTGVGSYLYYGSGSGLVTNVEPDISPVGKNPLKFAVNGQYAITFSTITTNYSSYGVNQVEYYNNKVQAVTYGKFNNDAYDDIVIRVNNTTNLPASVQSADLDYSGIGRVFIIYGGQNGPKLNTTTGRILYRDVSNNPVDVVSENPCDPIDNSICKVQMLSSTNLNSLLFGFSIQRRSLYNFTLSEYDGLLVSDPSYSTNGGNNDGIVYVYQGSARGITAEPIQQLIPRDNNTYFGYTVTEIGDANGDLIKDIAISAYEKPASSSRAQVITVFYGKVVQGKSAYAGDSGDSLAGTNYWSTPIIVDNQQNTTGLQPQVINPVISEAGDYLGMGMTGLGDINNDGFADFAINIPNGDFNISGLIPQTGYVLIFFGSSSGLQIDSTKYTPTAYPRCYQGTSPMCEPYQIYLPGYTENDYTHISADSVGDINGDGLTDLIIGVLGRSHPSGKGISTGVIYVLY